MSSFNGESTHVCTTCVGSSKNITVTGSAKPSKFAYKFDPFLEI